MKKVMFVTGLAALMLLTACNKEEVKPSDTEPMVEDDVKAVTEEKPKDVLVYEFEGKEVEEKLKSITSPGGYGGSAVLPEEFEEAPGEGFFASGTDKYKGINVSVSKEDFDGDTERAIFKGGKRAEVPVTGEVPKVTQLNLEDYPELEGALYLYKTETTDNLSYVFGKVVGNSLYTSTAVIMPGTDLAFEDFLVEILEEIELK